MICFVDEEGIVSEQTSQKSKFLSDKWYVVG